MLRDLKASTPGSVGLQTAKSHPNRHEIELRANHAYLERGGAPGQDLEDWLQAERELLEEYKKIGPVRMATAPQLRGAAFTSRESDPERTLLVQCPPPEDAK